MRYLGYQVKDEPSCAEELQNWMRANSIASIWGKTVVGSGSDYGIKDLTRCDLPFDVEDARCLTLKDNQCSFTTVGEAFTLTACDYPSDKWGNTASLDDGLHSGIELGYSDCSYTDYTPAEKLLQDQGIDFEDYDEMSGEDFIEWLQENCPEMIGEVSEKLICEGTAQNWTYYTTNVELSDPVWADIVNRYLSQWEL